MNHEDMYKAVDVWIKDGRESDSRPSTVLNSKAPKIAKSLVKRKTADDDDSSTESPKKLKAPKKKAATKKKKGTPQPKPRMICAGYVRV